MLSLNLRHLHSILPWHGVYSVCSGPLPHPEDGSRLAPMAVEMVDRLVILVDDRRCPSLAAADSRTLRCHRYARIKECVRR
jgi:hypothetical protein